MAAIRQLDLVLPGLAGPETDHPLGDYFGRRPAALDRLLSRSRCVAGGAGEPDSVLLQCFGMAADADPAVAELTGLVDLDPGEHGGLLRADPVHLRADQSSLRLFGAHSFDITQQEADALVASINAFNHTRDWQLVAAAPERWYLRLPDAPALTTASPFRVAGQNIDPFLPAGPDARHWRVMMNELQMLLHDHPVNQARMQRGQPVINSLWFWGGGELPAVTGTLPDAVYATLPLVAGLARHSGVCLHELPAQAGAVLQADTAARVLVVIDDLQWTACYNEVEHWLTALDRLEGAWFAPLLAALAGGRLETLVIHPCSGRRFHTGRWRQRAFWRSLRHYEECLSA